MQALICESRVPSAAGVTHTRTDHRTRGGFTLLEVLIVITIILVIVGMVVPQLLGRQRQANIDLSMISVKRIESACKLYAADHAGEYPAGGQEILDQLMLPSEHRGRKLEPYLEEPPLDAWDNKLFYQYPNEKADNVNKPAIWSAGPNGQDDGGAPDDVNNWDRYLE